MTYRNNYNLIDWTREIAPERKERTPVARSDMPCPMLISDSMPDAEHVDGKFYSSKSAYRRVTKANGLIEVGNDPGRFRKPKTPDRDKAIETSIDRAIARTKA